MKQEQWTSGPWATSFDEVVRIKGSDGAVAVATNINTFRTRRSPEEVAANARLISAAPLMYEALEALHHAVTSVRCRNLDECVLAADIALRTARGETQEQQK